MIGTGPVAFGGLTPLWGGRSAVTALAEATGEPLQGVADLLVARLGVPVEDHRELRVPQDPLCHLGVHPERDEQGTGCVWGVPERDRTDAGLADADGEGSSEVAGLDRVLKRW